MKKKKLDLGFVIVIAILLCAGVWCGYMANATPAKASEYTISVVLHDSGKDEWRNLRAGMRAAAREHGIRLNIYATAAEDHVEQEAELLEKASKEANGVIAELSDSSYPLSLKRSTPVVFVENPMEESYGNVYTINNEKAGETILMRILQNEGGDISSIGIINHASAMKCNQERLQGIEEKAEENGIRIAWVLSDGLVNATAIRNGQEADKADVLIALDNDSTEAAIDAKNMGGISAPLYGFGSSEKCLYNTDLNTIDDLVVPDTYVMGYKAVEDIYNQLNGKKVSSVETINYRLITRANLFTNKNQQILFPVS